MSTRRTSVIGRFLLDYSYGCGVHRWWGAAGNSVPRRDPQISARVRSDIRSPPVASVRRSTAFVQTGMLSALDNRGCVDRFGRVLLCDDPIVGDAHLAFVEGLYDQLQAL